MLDFKSGCIEMGRRQMLWGTILLIRKATNILISDVLGFFLKSTSLSHLWILKYDRKNFIFSTFINCKNYIKKDVSCAYNSVYIYINQRIYEF